MFIIGRYNGGAKDKEAFLNVKKKKKWIKWGIVLIIVVAVVIWFTMISKQTQSAAYTEVPVTTGDLTTYYNFDGLVHATRVQTITAAQAGTVRTVYVTQNEQVRKGDRLYRLEGGETVEADIGGEVTGLYIEEGDVVTAGEKVVEIIDMDRLNVELNVDEYDVAAMTPGKAVEVSVLATGAEFEGVVTALDKNGTASGDLSYYTATVGLGQSEGAYPGMQVSAKVLREHTENATIVKMDAIQFDEYNQPYVFMRSADGADVVRVSVRVGMSDGVNCEILDGVRAGETVLVKSGLSMAELMEQMRAQSGGASGR